MMRPAAVGIIVNPCRRLDVSKNFQIARRRLWSWEEQVSADGLDQETAQFFLDALIRDYNAAVAKYARKTRLQTVFLLVPTAIGVGIDIAGGGVWVNAAAGLGVSFVADKVKAKFPILGDVGAPVSHHPGSAVNGALSVVAHD